MFQILNQLSKVLSPVFFLQNEVDQDLQISTISLSICATRRQLFSRRSGASWHRERASSYRPTHQLRRKTWRRCFSFFLSFFFVFVRFKQLSRKQIKQKTTFLWTKSYYSMHFSIPLLSFADTTHLSNRRTRRSPRVALLSFHKIRNQLSESITKFSDARSDDTSCENSSLSDGGSEKRSTLVTSQNLRHLLRYPRVDQKSDGEALQTGCYKPFSLSRFQHDSGSCFCSLLVSRASVRPERLGGKSLRSSGPGWPGAGGTGSKLLSTVATCATISARRGYARKKNSERASEGGHATPCIHANDPRPMWCGKPIGARTGDKPYNLQSLLPITMYAYAFSFNTFTHVFRVSPRVDEDVHWWWIPRFSCWTSVPCAQSLEGNFGKKKAVFQTFQRKHLPNVLLPGKKLGSGWFSFSAKFKKREGCSRWIIPWMVSVNQN